MIGSQIIWIPTEGYLFKRMPNEPFLDQCRPPWLVFPELNPRELVGFLRQGATEAYFFNHWRPFWNSLDGTRREQYLDHWKATPEWRDAIAFHFNDAPLRRRSRCANPKSTWPAIVRKKPRSTR